METIIVLAVLVLLAVPVGVVVALVWIAGLRRRVVVLEQRLAQWQTGTAERADAPAQAPAQAPAYAPGRAWERPEVPDLDAGLGSSADNAAHVSAAQRGDGWHMAAAAEQNAADGSAVPPPLPAQTTAAAARDVNAMLQVPGQDSQPAQSQAPHAQSAQSQAAHSESGQPQAAQRQPTQPQPPQPAYAPAQPGPVARAATALKRWFTEGNVPVKVGMLVLLAGVASLLKYASDQGWMRMPIELRLAGISVLALVGLVFGWKQRAQRPGFALALQGGAIGGLLLTVFAAFKLYGLLDAGPALGISVVLIAGMCVLAVLQDSRTLAVLGVLAGFLAPIWLSTGSGNHVGLFTYYAVLNAGIVAIAWLRPWRALNLLGFAFTFGIGTLWGALQYTPAKFATTEPFLLLFFAMYVAILVLHARRGDGSAGKVIDGSLLFGTPLVAFALQARLLEGDRLPLALCAVAVAALYAGLASWLLRRTCTRLLGQAHAMLAVGFATLAIPLALSARATASVFALEGVGLLWLGLRQQRRIPQVSGVALQVLAAVGVAFGVDAWRYDAVAVANATCMSTLLIALAGWASAWFLRDAEHPGRALVAYLWGLGWWALCGVHEVLRFADLRSEPDLLLGFVALSLWLAADVHRRRPTTALVWTVMSGLALAAPLALWQVEAHTQPFAHWGALAWGVFALAGTRALWCLRRQQGAGAMAAQFIWWLLWPLVVSLGAAWLADAFLLANGWRCALLAAPWLIVATLGLLRWPWLAWPQAASFDPARNALLSCVFAVLGLGWLLVLLDPVSAAPLPWLPLFNPAELAQLAVLALLARWAWSPPAPALLQRWRVTALGVLGWALITGSTLHSVHHWGGVPWDSALISATLSQTSLTIVWSVLGVLGWVIGSRRGQRGLWLGGALLMGLVLAKLVLVDRQHLGNLLGIGSFMAYGLLCTVVGYLAPAPPRPLAAAEEHAVEDDGVEKDQA
ncbi:DUF2339 domain-containing protein [Xanthomonas vasicola]|uniref:DUF2339 domain-containing protein n=4 Tax=Xanthomonas vasicola TaxID=56459 RepID=A0ABD7S6L3_XANVA|nr:DUF2339 domain-containing protein [Xanthomonas vasicola]AZR23851.1 DUF2339 domain-containing protein [Xanthomonas vasicola]KGR40162.1 membrane protein [Xanthomonas vasicola]KGR40987.1 membrane protein [Xanthomonas vasicola]KGR60216.1 membrane protein [Xanthomonas vasicola]MDO6985265.1 DUF2339 domain-containing protein [Xanthomonas vasicola]